MGADSRVVEPAIVNGDAGVDERFASPPPVPPSPPPPAVSPPTVALGDLLGLADDPGAFTGGWHRHRLDERIRDAVAGASRLGRGGG
jgi:hypothetical protein